MSTVILYHANCFDGLHAAAVAKTALGNQAEYHAVNYDNMKTDFFDSDIVFLDVVYRAEQMQQLLNQGNRLVVVDHHNDNLKEVVPLGITIFNADGESGASLAWQFFFGEDEMPLAVQHARDYDLWLFNMANTEAFAAQQATFPMEIEHFQALHELKGDAYEAFVAKGQSILAYKQSIVASMASRAVPVKLLNFNGYAVNGPYELASEIGNQICNDKGGDFALVWFQQQNGKAKVSLRANSGSAPLQIAKKLFGGGGHEKASGAIYEINKLLEVLQAAQRVSELPKEKASQVCDCKNH